MSSSIVTASRYECASHSKVAQNRHFGALLLRFIFNA